MGTIYGYARISQPKQNIERQIRNIKREYPDAIIRQEVFTGTKVLQRKELNWILKRVNPGDTIVFDSVSRMSRNADDGVRLYQELYAFYKKGFQLYFYKNETTKREIDLIIQKDGMVVPIEVKSGNTRANSLIALIKNNKDISYGYKFADSNIGVSEEGIITLPLYMVVFVE